MNIPCFEPAGDPTVGLVEDDGLRGRRPITREGPMVRSQAAGDVVDASLVRREPAGGSEAVRSPVAQVRLARPEAAPIGGDFRALRVYGDELPPDPFDPGFGQELPDHDLRPVVIALAEPVMADAPLGVDEVQSRPILIRERVPDRVVAVDRDRIRDSHLGQRFADVLEVLLEAELRCVDADHDEPVIPVPVGPGADVGKRPDPVDAGVRAEVEEGDLPAQA